ncbi:putative reverse transcriptase domain-containing protein [Tanacetum coccineum]
MMTALELVNRRVTYQVDVCTRESSEFCTRHHDAQKDRAAVRAEIEVLRRERLAYEQESIQTRQDLARSEAHCRALEARVTVLETEVRRHEWQRQAADDLAVQHIMRTQALEAGARVDTLEDTGVAAAMAEAEASRVRNGYNSWAPARCNVVGNAGANPDNVVMAPKIDITPSTLDHYYDVKLADGRIIRLNTILKVCTLKLLNPLFNINLMPVELGSFDAIIGMDWLAKYQAVIVCAEKIVRIPWGNETLIIHGDGSNQGNGDTIKHHFRALKRISTWKKDFPYLFGTCSTTKEVEDNPREEALRTVPIVRDILNTGTLSIGAFQNERVIGATERAVRQRLYKRPQFLTLGSSGLVCQKERMDHSDVALTIGN